MLKLLLLAQSGVIFTQTFNDPRLLLRHDAGGFEEDGDDCGSDDGDSDDVWHNKFLSCYFLGSNFKVW